MLFATLVVSSSVALAQFGGGQRRAPTASQQDRLGPEIARVEVRGNLRVESEAIIGQLEGGAGERLDPRVVEQDIQRIYDLGFFNNIVVKARDSRSGVVLIIEVEEKPAVEEIAFRGNDEFDDEELMEKIDVEQGSILDEETVRNGVDDILKAYRDKGYFLAEVSYETEEVDAENVRVVYNIQEGGKIRVASVDFVGNEGLADDTILSVLETRPQGYLSFLTKFGKFKEESFQADLQRIRAFYYENGYLDIQVGDPLVELGRDGRSLFITIPVEEGPIYSIDGINITGNFLEGETADDLREYVKATDGEDFAASTVRGDIQRLEQYYKDKGRAFAQVGLSTQTNEEEDTVQLTYQVEPGPVAYIGRIEIVGNTITRDRVIRREIVINEGERYNGTQIDSSVRYIRRLGFFENVTVREERASEDSELVNLQFEVKERPTRTLQIGAGYSSFDGFIANAQISENNLFGRGQSLSFILNWSRLTRDFELRFTERRLFGSDWQLSLSLFNRHRVYSQFERDSIGASLSFGYHITREFLITAGWRAERVEASSRTDDFASRFYEQSDQRAVGPTLGAYYDTRNDRLFPTSGIYLGASTQVSDSVFGAEQNYIRSRGFTRFYWEPLWDHWVIRFNAEIGHLAATRSDEETPITERFYLGGSQSIRGFRDYRLSPCENRAVREDPSSTTSCRQIGGHKSLQFNLELEFPIVQAIQLRGVVFMDAGNAFGLRDPYSLRPDFTVSRDDRDEDYGNVLRTSVGFGFRWRSPIGPLRFEWGFPLARAPGEQAVQFAFGIGNLF
jgi:outer membrane protein insertion porin family